MQATLNPASPAREFVRAPQPQARNIAVDAYRGLVMLLMMAEVLRIGARGRTLFPATGSGAFLALQPDARRNGSAARCTI